MSVHKTHTNSVKSHLMEGRRIDTQYMLRSVNLVKGCSYHDLRVSLPVSQPILYNPPVDKYILMYKKKNLGCYEFQCLSHVHPV